MQQKSIDKNLENLSDAELVRLALQDKEGFYYLMKKYESKIMRYIKRSTNVDQAEAEDLLQEIFIKVYRNLNGFNQNLSFSSWIYRIVHNEIINHYHKNKRLINISNLEDVSDEIRILTEALSDEPDEYESIVRKEEAYKLKQALSELPQKYRDVLVLYYMEELSYAEISDVLKKPPGTVATLLNRAKSKFKSIAVKYNLKV